MTTEQPRIFVISLPHAHDRRESISRQLEEQGLDFEFIDAVHGKSLSEEERDRVNRPLLKHYRRPFSPNEVGCYLSHGLVYQKIAEERIPLAFVLEDDALIKANLKTLFAQIARLKTPWEFINVGSPPGQRKYIYVKERIGDWALIEYPHKEVGAHAYLMTHAAGVKLHRMWQSPYRAGDVQLEFTWRNGIRGYYYLLPNAVWVAEGLPSALTADRNRINEQRAGIGAKFKPGYVLSSASISLHWKWLQWRARWRLWRGELERPDPELFR